jgi:DNA-binding NarL/FixJ family response regulator
VTGQAVRVVIVDDHPMFRDGLRLALSGVDGIELIGEAATAADAVAMGRDRAPDVVLMDLQLPDGNGIDAAAAVLHDRPGTRILMLTMTDDDDSVIAALRAGAVGYVLKGADQAAVVAAIHAVSQGEAVFGPGIAQRILTQFGATVPKAPLPELSDREREVLTLVAAGLTNQAIATRLYLSPKTIRNHVSNILTKLQARNRVEAGDIARKAGL